MQSRGVNVAFLQRGCGRGRTTPAARGPVAARQAASMCTFTDRPSTESHPDFSA